jgi:hypothetical protein
MQSARFSRIAEYKCELLGGEGRRRRRKRRVEEEIAEQPGGRNSVFILSLTQLVLDGRPASRSNLKNDM